ncbi:MAG: hypothetical protein JWP67_1421 [Mucilaginibacter sp.]|nr:hypothetical protein [Mucilaginibacter sp.]
MQPKLNHKNRNLFILLFAVLSVVFSGYKYYRQTGSLVELKNERLAITPKEFYIAGITDVRTDNTIIGNLVPAVTAPGNQPNAVKLELKGGTAAIKNFINYSLPVNKSLRPIIIKLKTFKVTETPLPRGRVKGQVTLLISFGLQQEYDVVHLTDYTGNATYQRAAGPAQQIEPLLRSTLTNSLVYLNNWMNAQADNNIKLAKSVQIKFNDYTERVEGDTIYYNTNRPLKWTDFQQKPQPGSKHGAEIFASLGYNEHVELIKGVVTIKIDLKVFAPKSACWVREDVKDEYGLNHEQRHFDIVKLAAERFKKAIQAEKLSVNNYDGTINVAYFDALREIDKLQKQYDRETQHSANTYQQQLWNNKIDKELQQLSIKPNNI